ncbi:type III secretion system protein [Yersinia entomophaga]|uniref:Type III secretion system protein n=1 Tax=Yersinia entomophaga TaxID=935293 RepID=A0ABM6BN42_YERET|nr:MULTISPECIES: type III secretion system protein [Yersinia]ANI31041.1 type III secretion system protein [Yersinia entomophaga]OWF88684.1 type III secretion system protein [Yersinia entomophaga]
MKYKFIEMLNVFLSSVGRDDLVNKNLDCHSTVQLELDGRQAINVDMHSDDIILWMSLSEYIPSRIEQVSVRLLNSILEYQSSCFQPGQPALLVHDNLLIMSAVLNSAALDDLSLFANSLEEFFDRSTHLEEILIY